MQFQTFLQDLDSRIAASKVTGFWKPEDKERWLNKSVVRACNYARWKFLSGHTTQLTELNPDGTGKENYFLPFDFKPGGMILLKVDGEKYNKTSEDDYQGKTHPWERAFTISGDEYFIDPVAEEADKIIDLYYKKRPVPMVEPTNEPITPEEMDEPIIKLAFAICLAKTPGRAAEARKEIEEAHLILQQIKDREDEEPQAVYKGQATSMRWQ